MGAAWVGAAAAVAGAGASVYGASQSGGSARYDPFRTVHRNAGSFLFAAPHQFGLESVYQPAYGRIFQQAQQQQLFGSPGGRVSETVRFGPGPPRTFTFEAPAAPGLIGLLEQLQPRVQSLEQGSRLQDVNAFGPVGLAALGAYRDPRLESIANYGQNQLALGGRLDPTVAREVEQSVLRGQSARGMGQGGVDIYQQAVAMGQAAQEAQRQREAFALASAAAANQGNLDRFGVLPELMGPNRGTDVARGLLAAAGAYGGSAGPRIFPYYQEFTQPYFGSQTTANTFGALGGGLMNIGGALIANPQSFRRQGGGTASAGANKG